MLVVVASSSCAWSSYDLVQHYVIIEIVIIVVDGPGTTYYNNT